MNERKIYIIIIAVLSVLLIALGGYLIYSNSSKKDPVELEEPMTEKPFESLNIELSDPILKTLVYPKVNGFGKGAGVIPRYIYEATNLNSYGRDYMMIASAQGIATQEIEETSRFKYNGNLIKNNFINIFGPDTEYKDGDLENSYCCQIQSYNEMDNTYISDCRCGGEAPDFENHTKLYKAVQNEDNIETYFYVQPYVESDDGSKYYLFDRELESEMFVEITYEPGYNSYNIKNYSKVVNSLNEVDTMMNSGQVDTYIFTFKKQSDGNYYFYSGNWAN